MRLMFLAPLSALPVASPAISLQQFGSIRPIESALDASAPPVPLDVDQDGDLDLVGGSELAGDLWVSTNVGTSFERPRRLFAGLSALAKPLALGSADLDQDGAMEVFALVREANGDMMLHQLGIPFPGVLILQATLPTPISEGDGRSIVFRDLDGDGLLDLELTQGAVGRMGGQRPKWVGFQLSGGGFAFRDLSVSFSEGDDVALDDWSGAGVGEVVARTDQGVLSIARQVSPGVFGSPRPIDAFAVPERILQIEGEDVTGDGCLDLIVNYGGKRGCVIYEGLGRGQFSARTEVSAATSSSFLSWTDLDLDGDLDLIASPYDPAESIFWIESLGGLLFEAPATLVDLPERAAVDFVSLEDLTGDHQPDLTFALEDGIFLVNGRSNDSSGTPLDDRVVGIIDPRLTHERLLTADLDGDGDQEVVSAAPLAVAWNRGPGRLELPQVLRGISADLVSAGDLDPDPADELLIVESQHLLVVTIEDDYLASTRLIGGPVGSNGAPPVVLDAGADGLVDAVAVGPGAESVILFQQQMGGTFGAAEVLFSTIGVIRSLVSADFNGDELDDLAWISGEPGSAQVFWLPQLASGGFGSPVLVSTGPSSEASSLLAGDLDGNGTEDLAWLRRNDREVVVAANPGNGGFSSASAVGLLPGTPSGFQTVTGRARSAPDLVVSIEPSAGSKQGQVLLLEWIAGQQYRQPAVINDSIAAPLALTSADLDGDGDEDLALSGNLGWIPNREIATIGDTICGGAIPNSTGRQGLLTVLGRREVVSNDVRLIATDLPPRSLTVFLTSTSGAFTPQFGGGIGLACISGEIGRFDRPSEFGLTSDDGRLDLMLNLSDFPQPTGSVSVLAGQSWAFQAWHRDVALGFPTSNLSQGIAVVFL
ncbi:MAG: VCBS repeat-containing protein [Planctomycetota bacterium]